MKMLPVNPWAATPTPPSGPAPTLLLHFDGANGSTTFTDSSTNNWTMTGHNGAQLATIDPKFGTAELLLPNANTNRVSSPTDSAFTLGTGDFTVDCWAKPNGAGANEGLFMFGNQFNISKALNQWYIGTNGGGQFTQGATTTDRVHVAVTRSSGEVRLFIDGAQIGATRTIANDFAGDILQVGNYFDLRYGWRGTIDEFRYIKGAAVWTANFTPPDAPYIDP